MKRYFLLLLVLFCLNSCKANPEQQPYNFDNFKDTPISDVAIAVRDDDAIAVKRLLQTHKSEIDLKDPEFQQTLLALSIQNDKRKAFVSLLEAGADPNKLLGNPEDATSFIYAVRNVDDCDFFYVEKLLEYGADPNMEIKNPVKGHYFNNSFPLLAAIGNSKNSGDECIDLVKLLVDKGANVNICYMNEINGLCEGPITYSLKSNSMLTLRYFVIDKKIIIPDVVFATGGVDNSPQKLYSLSEILNDKDFLFDDPRWKDLKKAKEDILEYLKSIGKK